MKKTLITIFLPLILGSFVFSQSLAELAKKEKERRESLKGKKSVVVTNRELTKLNKTEALSIPPAAIPPQSDRTAAETEKSSSQPPVSGTASSQAKQPQNLDAAPPAPAEIERKGLEDRWNKALEYVELLTLKLNALWQQFYSLDDMTTRDKIQKDISETYLKLQNAQEEENKARIALEKIVGRLK